MKPGTIVTRKHDPNIDSGEIVAIVGLKASVKWTGSKLTTSIKLSSIRPYTAEDKKQDIISRIRFYKWHLKEWAREYDTLEKIEAANQKIEKLKEELKEYK
jgi:hypothetical protein